MRNGKNAEVRVEYAAHEVCECGHEFARHARTRDSKHERERLECVAEAGPRIFDICKCRNFKSKQLEKTEKLMAKTKAETNGKITHRPLLIRPFVERIKKFQDGRLLKNPESAAHPAILARILTSEAKDEILLDDLLGLIQKSKVEWKTNSDLGVSLGWDLRQFAKAGLLEIVKK